MENFGMIFQMILEFTLKNKNKISNFGESIFRHQVAQIFQKEKTLVGFLFFSNM
jgi:hypothetical protein